MDFLTLKHLKPKDIEEIIDLSIDLKKNPEKYSQAAKGKTLAMLFQKTSTRTRCSFETAMTQMGGHGQYLDWRTTNFTLGALKDEIRCLERYVDIIMARVYKQKDLETMALFSRVPVINGLSDMYHPCQALADLLTIKEKMGGFDGVKLAFVGDGNNVCHSLILACAKMGIKISVATPAGYEPSPEVVSAVKKYNKLTLTHNPKEAVNAADIVYTDTWVSMGQEAEKEKRLKVFRPYQVNRDLLGSSNPLIMHCLPAHRGYEITDEVLDSPYSVVFDQAENRLHVQKAVILKLLQ